MIEKDFRDRVPSYPGRVRLVHVSGDVYDMVRADEPMVEGTPIDKATFNSIVHSRLTGRFYDMTVAKTTLNSQSFTASPIPTGGWILNETKTQATSGSYTIFVSSAPGSYTPDRAVDGNASSFYESNADGEIVFRVVFPAEIKVKKYKLAMRASNYTYAVTTEFQGSNNGTAWTTLFTTTEKPDNLTEYTLTSTGEYSQYRLKFTATETGIRVYEFQISSYDVVTYKNAFTVSFGFPTAWTKGQRAMVQTPASFSTLAVASNTLNGVSVSTVLLPNKRYELYYTGAQFTAKEV